MLWLVLGWYIDALPVCVDIKMQSVSAAIG